MNTGLESKDLTSNEVKPMLAEVIKELDIESLLNKYGNEVIYELGEYIQKISINNAFGNLLLDVVPESY